MAGLAAFGSCIQQQPTSSRHQQCQLARQSIYGEYIQSQHHDATCVVQPKGKTAAAAIHADAAAGNSAASSSAAGAPAPWDAALSCVVAAPAASAAAHTAMLDAFRREWKPERSSTPLYKRINMAMEWRLFWAGHLTGISVLDTTEQLIVILVYLAVLALLTFVASRRVLGLLVHHYSPAVDCF